MSDGTITRFGDPILRQIARKINDDTIHAPETKQLIDKLKSAVEAQNGVGVAAPQLGVSAALCAITIHPTKLHPNAEIYTSIVINPSYQGVGRRVGMWEGCLSAGEGDDILYGKALRYKSIKATWIDESGRHHNETLHGFVAHVFQHETDHLNGILFVDRVRDNTTLILASEFMKHVLPSLPKQ